ncbi:oxidoreductase [Flagellimonas aquimarina]|uniref:Oxidoreductase n=1 Tax=Flagellimonas aquimarina TaxID=2201895 RepID=A0A316L6H2_9FLAO|nr:oxidoreductase [Allomuricauda koreensis]
MKKAIVIGATSGIGRELALVLSKNNYKVGITGRRSALLKALEQKSPGSFISMAFDCTEEHATIHLEQLIEKLEGLDLLIFSSGTGDLNEALVYDIEKMTNTLNVVAFSKIMGWAFKLFQKQGNGHVVAITSIGGLRGSAIAPAYNASKAYQINYLEGLRQKAKKLKMDITLTDVRPGFVNTAMAKGDGQFWVASPKKAANQIFLAISRKKDRVYITKRWQLIAIIVKILPNWLYKRM